MVKLPQTLDAANLTKNKAHLAKLQAQIPNLGNKLVGVVGDAKEALGADYAKMFNIAKTGSLDPVNFAAMHKKAHEGSLALLTRIDALEKALETALKDKAVAKDKKVVAYAHELESALLAVRASVRKAERDSDGMDAVYQAALKHSPIYLGLASTVPHAPAARKALLDALADIRRNPTVNYAVDTLTRGEGDSVARKYTTSNLGPWLNVVDKHLPKLGASLFKGDVMASYMRNTWIDVAANKPKEALRAAIDKLVAAKGETDGVIEFADEYEKQVKRTEGVMKALQTVWAEVQKAAG